MLFTSLIPFSHSAKIKTSIIVSEALLHSTSILPPFPKAPSVVKDHSLPTTDKPLNNDHQKQDEEMSTSKPDQGPGFVAEPRVMLNPFFDQGLST